MKKPELISIGEWWYKGCFIQKQEHLMLSKYVVFKDTKDQEHVGCCSTMIEAKRLCKKNEVVDYKLGVKSFI